MSFSLLTKLNQKKEQLVDWIKYCESLKDHAIEAVGHSISRKGSNDYEVK